MDTMVANFDMAQTYRHFLHVIRDSQNTVGSVPAKVPAYPPALYYNNDAGGAVPAGGESAVLKGTDRLHCH